MPSKVKIIGRFSCFLFTLLSCGTVAWGQLSADFSMDQPGGCSPLAVSFANKTTGASSRAIYSWDFGNGNTSALTDPGAIYTNEQIYKVTLTVQDGGQISSKTNEITVYKRPTVGFTPSVAKGCLPLDIHFTSQSSPGDGNISAYTWDFGDGSTQQGYDNTQPHTYTVPQTVTVSLTVTNNYGCHSTSQKKDIVTVIPSLTASFSSDKKVLCSPSDPVQFSNTSTGPGTLSYLWDFGDGHSSTQLNPGYAFNKKGIFSVQLTVKSTEGCVAVARQSDDLNVASYKTDFDGPASLCQSSYGNFNNLSTPTPDNSLWEVDGIPIYGNYPLSYWFGTPGVHTVKLDNLFGACPQSVSKTITVKAVPVMAAFAADATTACGGATTYHFQDHTAGAVKWEWDFDYRYDPPQVGSTQQSPSYTYGNGGSYPVWLRVTNAAGCSSTSIQNIQFASPFTAITTDGNISLNSCDEPITQTFLVNTNQDLTGYQWDFGDGGTSTDASPTHTFHGDGRYTVTLHYITRQGCKGSVSNSNYITIYPKLKLDFSAAPNPVCGNEPVYFTATPDDPNVIYWLWDYGDGQYSYNAGARAAHNYNAAGTYTVKLHATGPACTAEITKENYVTVRDLEVKISAFTHSCDGTRGEMSFTQTSVNASRLIWNFGDGTTLTTPADQLTVKHTYKTTGSFPVSLIASNGQCTESDNLTAYVLLKQNPTLSSAVHTACSNDNVPIQIAGLQTNPEPYSYNYPYNLQKLEYADGSSFDGNRNDPYNGWQNTYDGSINSFRRTDETFRAIVISSYFNCQDTSNFISVKIKGATAGFEVIADGSCYQSAVVLKDTSRSTANNAILSWLWDFGDGQTSLIKQSGTVSHIYKTPGSYLATLQINDAAGCSSTTPPYGQRVNADGPLAAFTASGTLVPLNSSIYFSNNSNTYGSPNTAYTWNFGDGTAVSHGDNPTHTYPVAGSYLVTLTASNQDMPCNSTAGQTIVVKNFNTAFGFTTSYVSGNCPPVLVSFNNTSVNYTRVSWDFGDGITADNLSYPSHVYEKPGKYIITLYGYAPNGLQETHMDSILIKTPEGSVTADPLEVCTGSPVNLSAKALNTNTYLWDFGDGTINTTNGAVSTHLYLSPGLYQPNLMMQDGNGCYGKAVPATAVTVRPDPVVQISPQNPLICLGSAIPLHASGASHYAWSPAAGLSDERIADPLASPDATRNYTLQVTDDFGCKNSSTLTVEVIQPGKIRVSADTAVCAGSPVPLLATGEEIYQWIGTTDGLNNTGIANPVALPPASLTYTVTGEDQHHCFTDMASVHIRVMPLPEINAGPDVEIWSGESTPLNGDGSNDVIRWSWQPEKYLNCYDCPSPVSTPLAETNYIVTVKNQDGCLAADTVLVKVDCAATHVFIPNVFTPNRDGHNDLFVVKGIAIIKHMVIYGRWGEKVFERNNFIAGDPSDCWNGTYQGMASPSGSYVYFIEMECPTGGLFVRKGSVVLIR
jgi:gliding motility-associated-like protein